MVLSPRRWNSCRFLRSTRMDCRPGMRSFPVSRNEKDFAVPRVRSTPLLRERGRDRTHLLVRRGTSYEIETVLRRSRLSFASLPLRDA